MQLEQMIDVMHPGGVTAVVDTGEVLYVQNGYSVTRVAYSSVRSMSLDTYLKRAKTFNDELIRIVDYSNSQYVLVKGQEVLVFDAPEVREAGEQEMLEESVINRDALTTTVFNDRYPLLAIYSGKETIAYVVKIPGRMRSYKYVPDKSVRYYQPDCVMRITCNKAGVVEELRLAVIASEYPHWTRATVYRWPLSNVYADGKVCLGTTTVIMPGADGSVQCIIDGAVSQMFNSVFNGDLMVSPERLLLDRYAALPEDKKVHISRNNGESQVLSVLNSPIAAENIGLRALGIDTARKILGDAYIGSKEMSVN